MLSNLLGKEDTATHGEHEQNSRLLNFVPFLETATNRITIPNQSFSQIPS